MAVAKPLLEADRALLATVVERMPIGVIIVEAPSGRLLAFNARIREIWGEPDPAADTFLEDSPWTVFRLDGTAYSPAEMPLARAAVGGEVVTSERVELRRTDGSRVVLDVNATPILDEQGDIVAAVATVDDVTTRDRQQRTERDFVTNAAHQIQTPLAAIISAVEVLQAGAKDTPERDLFLGHVERETQRLARLARALLVLARAEAQTEVPRAELVSVCELLHGLADGVTTAGEVAVEVDCPSDLAIVANRYLLEEAVANLAANAAKYTERGRVVLRARPARSHVEIAVTDTGPGIPPAERPRVFERFYRADTTRGGSGLGLAIVRAAVDAMGGELVLDSTVGVGTVVTIRLPRGATMLDT